MICYKKMHILKEKVLKKKKKEVKMPLRGRKEMKLGKGTQEAIKVKCIS